MVSSRNVFASFNAFRKSSNDLALRAVRPRKHRKVQDGAVEVVKRRAIALMPRQRRADRVEALRSGLQKKISQRNRRVIIVGEQSKDLLVPSDDDLPLIPSGLAPLEMRSKKLLASRISVKVSLGLQVVGDGPQVLRHRFPRCFRRVSRQSFVGAAATSIVAAEQSLPDARAFNRGCMSAKSDRVNLCGTDRLKDSSSFRCSCSSSRVLAAASSMTRPAPSDSRFGVLE